MTPPKYALVDNSAPVLRVYFLHRGYETGGIRKGLYGCNYGYRATAYLVVLD